MSSSEKCKSMALIVIVFFSLTAVFVKNSMPLSCRLFASETSSKVVSFVGAYMNPNLSTALLLYNVSPFFTMSSVMLPSGCPSMVSLDSSSEASSMSLCFMPSGNTAEYVCEASDSVLMSRRFSPYSMRCTFVNSKSDT